MSEIPALLAANRAFAARFAGGDLPRAPRLPIAVLTCIDARMDPERSLGLQIGDANVLRNAGGRASDDAIRSLLVSGWLLGTREFLVIHHTDCALAGLDQERLVHAVREATGGDVSDVDFLRYADLDESVREDVERIRALGDRLPDGVQVSGFVYDVHTGEVREVVPAESDLGDGL